MQNKEERTFSTVTLVAWAIVNTRGAILANTFKTCVEFILTSNTSVIYRTRAVEP